MVTESQSTLLESYDVVVVGAGPAGTAAAYTIASQNLRVCLVDKVGFPRDKLCGGLITLRSMDLLGKIFQYKETENLFLSSKNVIFKMNGDILSKTQSRWPLYFTMRREFDATL